MKSSSTKKSKILMGTDDKLILYCNCQQWKWKLKELSIQWKSLILDLCNILYLDINHAGSVLRCYMCNLQKPISAIEDTQHYPCRNSCLVTRCMKYCCAFFLKKIIDVKSIFESWCKLHVYRYLPLVEIWKLQYECKRTKQTKNSNWVRPWKAKFTYCRPTHI